MQNSCLGSAGSGSCSTQSWRGDNRGGGGGEGGKNGGVCAGEGGIEALWVQLVYH